MTNIAINGFGRIGRPTFKRILDKHADLQIVAINDLGNEENLAYLLKYDSVYGIYNKDIKAGKGELIINGDKVKVLNEKDPAKLPWKRMDIDVVLECTGAFRDDSVSKHLEAGAKKVIISAPPKTEGIPMFIIGVNEEKYNGEEVISMASCTTNCMAAVAKVINQHFGIQKGFFTTVHSYTNDQRILDLQNKDLRRSRAAGLNIIPTTTGAAKAIEKCLPELKGKLDGVALRVPTPTVSTADFVAVIDKDTTAEELNYTLKKASDKKELKGILGVEDAPLVSSDYIGNSYSAIIDSLSTQVNNNLIKVLAWYDNEWSYACRLAELTEYICK